MPELKGSGHHGLRVRYTPTKTLAWNHIPFEGVLVDGGGISMVVPGGSFFVGSP